MSAKVITIQKEVLFKKGISSQSTDTNGIGHSKQQINAKRNTSWIE
jgi:hypothetical protein